MGLARISGDLYDADWDIFGKMTGLRVSGRVENTTVRTTDDMGAITLGAALNSSFLAGIARDVTTMATNPTDIVNPDASIRSIIMSAKSLPGTGETPFFQNSNFSAESIGPVSLRNLVADNAGQPHGFYAGTISSIRHQNTETRQQWVWQKQTDGVLNILDFTADAFDTSGPV